MDTTTVKNKVPLHERINYRILAVLAVVLFLVGYPVYTFVQAQLNGGAKSVGDAWQVDLKALGNFPFNDQTSTINDIPQKWRDLDGKQVILEGFMFAPASASNDISSFQFVYNITKCCFNGPPLVQERVFARVPKGEVPYSSGLVRCTGKLHVGVKKNEVGKTDAIYEMEVQSVQEL